MTRLGTWTSVETSVLVETVHVHVLTYPIPSCYIRLLQWSTILNAWLVSPKTSTKPVGVRCPNKCYWDGRISGFRFKYQPTLDYRAHADALEQAAAVHAAEMSTPRLFGNAQSEFTDLHTFSVTVSLRGDHAPTQWGQLLDVFSREHFHKHAFGRERGKGKGHIHYQGMTV